LALRQVYGQGLDVGSGLHSCFANPPRKLAVVLLAAGATQAQGLVLRYLILHSRSHCVGRSIATMRLDPVRQRLRGNSKRARCLRNTLARLDQTHCLLLEVKRLGISRHLHHLRLPFAVLSLCEGIYFGGKVMDWLPASQVGNIQIFQQAGAIWVSGSSSWECTAAAHP
jgi:hypothetical protein